MVWAASLSLPLALKTAARVMKTGEQKDGAGEGLIKYFSVPQKVGSVPGCVPDAKGGRDGEGCAPLEGEIQRFVRHMPEDNPVKWERFKEYCLQDVRTEREIRKRLEGFPLPVKEWENYWMDQRINDKGVRIDRKLVEEAIECDERQGEKMMARARELTGLENPNSVSQLKGWLEGRGISIHGLDKESVTGLIRELEETDRDADALEMMRLRLQMAKSSVKKYLAAERYICRDGRAHGLFQFSGASRTQRWAGRGIQLQNLPQNKMEDLEGARDMIREGRFEEAEEKYGSLPEVLSQLSRTMLVPRNGCEFIIADFSAIEARVLAWLAGEEWALEAFRKGQDLYCATASQMFRVTVVKHGINGELRQKGKIATLACGYGGSVGALTAMGALSMGLKEEELPEIIASWREANPRIVGFWRESEDGAIQTVRDQRERSVGRIRMGYAGKTLWITLPSGRRLAYLKPKLQVNRFGRTAVSYEQMGQNSQWGREETYGGKLVENITQATARDLLAEAMRRLEGKGYQIVAHVHDEVIVEVEKGRGTVETVCGIMNEAPGWARGLPLACDGYVGEKFYFKN